MPERSRSIGQKNWGRVAIVVGFLLVSGGVTYGAFVVGTGATLADFLVNMGTEIFGIVITLAIVHRLLERGWQRDRAIQVAWTFLHEVERVVWLWQGGPRRMEPSELLAVIDGIDPADPLHRQTRAALVQLGDHAREVLNREAAAVGRLKGLRRALNELTALVRLGERDSAASTRITAEVVETAARELIETLGLYADTLLTRLIQDRDSTMEAQEERSHGATVGRGYDTSPLGGGAL